MVGNQVEVHGSGNRSHNAQGRAFHHPLRVHPVQHMTHQVGRAARRGIQAGVPVGDVGLGQLGVLNGLLHRAPGVNPMRRHAAQDLALDRVARGKSPVLGIGRIGGKSPDGRGYLDRDLGALKRRIALKPMTHLAQTPGHGGGIVADAGDKAESGDVNFGHAVVKRRDQNRRRAGDSRHAMRFSTSYMPSNLRRSTREVKSSRRDLAGMDSPALPARCGRLRR